MIWSSNFWKYHPKCEDRSSSMKWHPFPPILEYYVKGHYEGNPPEHGEMKWYQTPSQHLSAGKWDLFRFVTVIPVVERDANQIQVIHGFVDISIKNILETSASRTTFQILSVALFLHNKILSFRIHTGAFRHTPVCISHAHTYNNYRKIAILQNRKQ